MNSVKRLEVLSESIQNEIDELQSLLENSDDALLKAKRLSFQKQLENIVSNLESANDSVYSVYEDLNCEYNEEFIREHDVMRDILQEKLSYEEKIDLRIKYGIHL